MDIFQLVKNFFLTKDLNLPFGYSVLICLNVRLLKFNKFMELYADALDRNERHE